MEKVYNSELNNSIKEPIITTNFSSCINKAAKKEKVICMVSELEAKFYQKKYLETDGARILNIVYANMFGDFVSMPFENASPIVENFQILMQFLIESGIPRHWEFMKQKAEIMSPEIKENEIQDPFITFRLTVIYVTGCLLSAIVFIAELLSKYFKFNITIKV